MLIRRDLFTINATRKRLFSIVFFKCTYNTYAALNVSTKGLLEVSLETSIYRIPPRFSMDITRPVSIPSYELAKRSRWRFPGPGMRTSSSQQPRGLLHKTNMKLLILICLLVHCNNNKLNDPIIGSLVRNWSRVFNAIHTESWWNPIYGSFYSELPINLLSTR